MLNFLRCFYTKADKLMNWVLTQRNIKNLELDIRNGGLILICLLAIVLFIFEIAKESFIFMIFTSLFIACLFFCSAILFYKSERKGIYKIFTRNTPEKRLKIFSHTTIIYGLFLFIFYCGIFEIIILSYLLGFIRTPASCMQYFADNIINITYINSTIFIVLWFGYHIAFGTVPILEIKKKVSFYLAVYATLSTGLVLQFLNKILNPTILSLGVGFAWVYYLIDLKEEEELTKHELS